MTKNKKKHFYYTCSNRKNEDEVFDIEFVTCLSCLKLLITTELIDELKNPAKKRLEILKYHKDFEKLVDNDTKKE